MWRLCKTGGLSVTSISSRLLHVNENDEIGIKSRTMGFRKVRCEMGKGRGRCVCVVQPGCAHVRRASLRFPREVTGERKRRERRTRARRGALCESRWWEGENEREIEGYGKGAGEPRVNRICMETVCQWVASSCGYLTLFTSPPRLFIAILLNLHLSTLFLSFFLPLVFPLRFCSPVFLTSLLFCSFRGLLSL